MARDRVRPIRGRSLRGVNLELIPGPHFSRLARRRRAGRLRSGRQKPLREYMTQLSLFSCEKRWRKREERWVTPAEHFKPHGYAVDGVPEFLARRFVEQEHYSGTFPAARISVGLWGPGPELTGVAVFSVPMSKAVLPRWT